MNTNTVLKSEILTNTVLSDEKVIGGKNDFVLPSDMNTTSLTSILKANHIPDEKIKELINGASNDNLFLPLPTDENQRKILIVDLQNKVKSEIQTLKDTPLSKDAYKERLLKAQSHAAHLLIAECSLGEELRAMPKNQGKHSNSDYKTKLQKIKETYGLTRKQALEIQKLDWECVIAAIIYAFREEEIPTRSKALSKNRKIKNVKQSLIDADIDLISLSLNPIYEDDYKITYFHKPLYATSLFACIGSGTSRLKELNVHCAVANEYLSERADVHKKLDPDCLMIQGSITNKKIFKEIVKAHRAKGCRLLLASPPCQIASNLNTSENKEEDSRANLFYNTIKFVKNTHPDYIVIENVPQWLNTCPKVSRKILKNRQDKKKSSYLTIGEYITRQLTRLGYNVNIEIVNAADYWTAEERKRCIILACKRKFGVWKFPKKGTHKLPLWKIIGDLPSIEPGQASLIHKWHYALPLQQCQINFIAHTPTACSAFDNAKAYQPVNSNGTMSKAQFEAAFTRLDWNKPGKTITTGSGFIGGTYTIHPGQALTDGTYSDCRVLSILELLRIIGLPDDFLEPLNLPMVNNMLSSTDDSFIREVLGEHVCPKVYNELMSTLPL